MFYKLQNPNSDFRMNERIFKYQESALKEQNVKQLTKEGLYYDSVIVKKHRNQLQKERQSKNFENYVDAVKVSMIDQNTNTLDSFSIMNQNQDLYMNFAKDSKSDEESTEPRLKRFRITPKEEEFKWCLPQELVDYLQEHIDNFIPEKDLKEKVLGENPVPANCPKVRKLDEFLDQFLNSHDERLDTSLSKIEAKIRDVLGPLSKLWLDLENLTDVSNNEEVELDLNSLLERTHSLS